MTAPTVTVEKARNYGYDVLCTSCGKVAHRELEIDADTLARRHLAEHRTRTQLRSVA